MNKDKITKFICVAYCQFCDNKCNVTKIMEKYQNNSLNATQMKEVTGFNLEKVSCKSHIPNEGFTMFGHRIEIYYKDGTKKEHDEWVSPKEISKIWDNDAKIDFIDIVFTDV